jgi:hypothetical protein
MTGYLQIDKLTKILLTCRKAEPDATEGKARVISTLFLSRSGKPAPRREPFGGADDTLSFIFRNISIK